MPKQTSKGSSRLVERMVRLWPRETMYIKAPDGKKKSKGKISGHPKVWENLTGPGVYILYIGDRPFYVGQAENVGDRLYKHSKSPNENCYNFWTHFSAFFVKDKRSLNELEGILINSIPTLDNSKKPNFKRVIIPRKISLILRHKIYEEINR